MVLSATPTTSPTSVGAEEGREGGRKGGWEGGREGRNGGREDERARCAWLVKHRLQQLLTGGTSCIMCFLWREWSVVSRNTVGRVTQNGRKGKVSVGNSPIIH